MSKVHVAVGVDPTERYHESKDCPAAGELVKADKSEFPRSVGPCSYCAGGVSVEELRKKYGEKA